MLLLQVPGARTLCRGQPCHPCLCSRGHRPRLPSSRALSRDVNILVQTSYLDTCMCCLKQNKNKFHPSTHRHSNSNTGLFVTYRNVDPGPVTLLVSASVSLYVMGTKVAWSPHHVEDGMTLGMLPLPPGGQRLGGLRCHPVWRMPGQCDQGSSCRQWPRCSSSFLAP